VSDEHKLIRDAGRASRATSLLNDELLVEAFATLEAAYIKAWRESGTAPTATHGRERLWQAVNLIGKVQEHLRIIIENGKLARHELNEIEGKRGRPKQAA